MKWLLKCYYGYRNRGDELLFFGVMLYVFEHYSDLTSLDVECGDVSWMSQWCELNYDLWDPYKSRVRFVPSRTFSMWTAGYDVIFAGWWEVLAHKWRNLWHAGCNYLALFWRWIWTRRVVWLWGIETPTTWRSKLLYRMMLPYAREVVCREQGSYDIAMRYTDRVVLYHDWAIDILNLNSSTLKGYQGPVEKWMWSSDSLFGVSKKYILINFIPKYTSPEIIVQFHEWLQDYLEYNIINFSAEQWDILPEEIREQYGDRIQTRKRWEHSIDETLQLYQQTQAWFGQRLHFIIPCVYYHIPIRRLAYSEKVNKILQFFEQMEL